MKQLPTGQNKKINVQGKSSLARLMAIENLHVTHDPSASTASFDLKNRVVTLPILKQMSGFIYDWFISHEVSHAINTPMEGYEKLAKETHPAVANICEDARIEKLIKRKYPGTVRDAYMFYKHFSSDDQDFFGLKSVPDLNNLTLIDKLNLHFKIGHFNKIPFAQEEMRFVDMLADAETFQQVDKAAREIFKWMKNNNQVQEIQGQGGLTVGEDADGEGDQSSENGMDGEGKDSSDKQGKSGKDTKGKVGNGKQFIKMGHTQDSFDNNFKNVFENQKYENTKFGDVHDRLYDIYENYISPEKEVPTPTTIPPKDAQAYNDFLRTISPTINMMISHFNMKKAARDHERTLVATTGRLDMKKLSTHKIKDDIFRKNELVPEHKNHGMVMFIDWSGSMGGQIFSTLKQLMILMEFCRKTQIPFEVYGFTTGYNYSRNSAKSSPKGTDIFGDSSGKLFMLFNSSMKTDAFRRRSQWAFGACKAGDPNRIHSMGSTPLNHCAFLSEYVIGTFQRKYQVEKTVFLLLSDGEPTDYVVNGGGGVGHNKVIMRDRNNGRNYTLATQQSAFHNIFEYVKVRNSVWKMIGFFLTNGLNIHECNLISPNVKDQGIYNKAMKEFADKKVFVFPKNNAFDKYFAISVNNFDAAKAPSTNMTTQKDFDAFMTERLKSMVFLRTFIEEIS